MNTHDPYRRDYSQPNTNGTSSGYSPSVSDTSSGFPDDVPQWYKLASLNEIQNSPFSTNSPKQFLPRVYLPDKTREDEQPYATFNDSPVDYVTKRKEDKSADKNNNVLLSMLAVGLLIVIVAIPVTVVLVLQRDVAVITEGIVIMELTLDEQFLEKMADRNSDLYTSTEKAICEQ
ncbi:uncharacterized protein LOC110463642, partial [Mizuhopecten yessoensis]|uniref:uncharacterized protein LOC110463642 n=1 Tax=Mizuhopecten yessoensis TaxID=6573 RepID=UPI000B45CBA8